MIFNLGNHPCMNLPLFHNVGMTNRNGFIVSLGKGKQLIWI